MKSTEDEFEVRKGPGYQWFMSSGGDYSRYDVSGFTIDNLDTKKIEDAENDFERVFIEVREGLKYLESCSLDSENDRLQVCHNLARRLSAKFKKK